MKIIIWINKSDAISGKINKWYNTCPNTLDWKDYVQVEISQDEFTKLNDMEGVEITPIPESLKFIKDYHNDVDDSGDDDDLEDDNLFEQEEQYAHDASQYDFTRNMTPEQAEQFNNWKEGLSPIEQAYMNKNKKG